MKYEINTKLTTSDMINSLRIENIRVIDSETLGNNSISIKIPDSENSKFVNFMQCAGFNESDFKVI